MSKLRKISPAWHADAIAHAKREFGEFAPLNETIRRKRARLGLMLIYIKERGKSDNSIPHGQFGPWLEENLPDIPRSTAGLCITEGNSICDLLRWQISKIWNFDTPPHELLLAKPEDLNGTDRDRQTNLFDLIEERKHFAAVTQYKQVELKDDATVAKKGRRKGEGGASREQRTLHKLKLHEADLKGKRLFLANLGDALDQAADDTLADPELAEAFDAVYPKLENCFRTWQRIQAARVGKG